MTKSEPVSGKKGKGSNKKAKAMEKGKGPRSHKKRKSRPEKVSANPIMDEDTEPEHLPPKGERWTSAVSFDANSLSKVFRETLEQEGFKFKRTQADKMYQQTMVLFPIPKSAYVYRFEISSPVRLWVDFYDTKPSHAGVIPFMDIMGLTPKTLRPLKKILDKIIERLVRPPWKFTSGQRLQHGLLIPEWGRAKKAWRKLGYII